MLFSIDSWKIKKLILQKLEAKEGDLKGSRINAGSTVQPVAEVADFVDKVKTTALLTAAATTAVWTPDAGKKVLLKGGVLVVSRDSTAAGTIYVSILDGTTELMRVGLSSAALAVGSPYIVPFDFKGGYLSVNGSPVNITLSSAFTAGGATLTVWGNEI